MNLFLKTLLGTTCLATIGLTNIAQADDMQINRIGAFTGSTYGADFNVDMTGVSALFAVDDRYVVQLEYADLDYGIPLDASMMTVKTGLGSYGENERGGWGYWYIGYSVVEIELMGESADTDAAMAGLHFIGSQSENFEIAMDLGVVHPLDDEGGDTYLEGALDINYYIGDNFALGAYGSVTTDGDGTYGLSATYRF